MNNLLFHFSDDPSIQLLVPQPLSVDPGSEPMVWGIDARHSVNYYLPRDCPRVTFGIGEGTGDEDVERFLGHTSAHRVIAIESGWLDRVRSARLYRYHLPAEGFTLQDVHAGYHVSRQEVKPLKVDVMNDLLGELISAGVELRVMPSLWKLCDAVAASTLEFSIIRMRNAAPRQ